jgi:hypothetical protein
LKQVETIKNPKNRQNIVSETKTQLVTGSYLVRALLFGPMSEPYTIPTIAPALYSAFMNGLLIHMQYETDRLTYFERDDSLPFEFRLWKQFEKALQADNARIRINNQRTIQKWMKPQPHLRSSSPFFYAAVRKMLRGHLGKSTYTPEPRVLDNNKAWLQLGNPEDLEEIIRISQNARPFIEKDVSYIREHYTW